LAHINYTVSEEKHVITLLVRNPETERAKVGVWACFVYRSRRRSLSDYVYRGSSSTW